MKKNHPHFDPPPLPPPIFRLQGYRFQLDHGNSLVFAVPGPAPENSENIVWKAMFSSLTLDIDTYYRDLQRWLQVASFWYQVVGQPMVDDDDYEAVREAAYRWHVDMPDEAPLPYYWWHNHLSCRYDYWCRTLFDPIPLAARKPRNPWVYGEPGIFNRPIDFSSEPAKIGSRGSKGVSSTTAGKINPGFSSVKKLEEKPTFDFE